MAVRGVFTDVARERLASATGGELGAANVSASTLRAYTYRYGEGGSQTILGSTTPKTPDAALTDIEAQGFGVNGLYYIEKSLDVADISVSGRECQIVCELESGEGNDRGDTTAPTFWELGVYDESGALVVYMTFDGETKTPVKTLRHTIRLTF